MTKHLIHFLPLLLCLLFGGCSNRTPQYPQSLLVADSLAMCNPDSAVTLLSELAPQMASASDPVRHYYELLTIKARDKAFLPFESDSLVLATLDYYENGGDVQHLPEAYYYMGRYLSDLGDAPKALEYFQKTLDALYTQANEYSWIRSASYAQMGYLFREQHLYEYALKSFEIVYKEDSHAGNILGVLRSKREIGNILYLQQHYDEALTNYNIADSFALMLNDTLSLFNNSIYKAKIYLKLRQYDKAKECSEQFPLMLTQSNYVASLSLLADLYSKTNKKDLALDYYRLLLKSEDIIGRVNANHWMANYSFEHGKIADGFEFLNEYNLCIDTLESMRGEEVIALSHSLYNYNLREKENAALKLKESQMQTHIYMVVSFAVLLLFLTYYFYILNKRSRLQCENLRYIIAANNLDKERRQEITTSAIARIKKSPTYRIITDKEESKLPLTENEWKTVEQAFMNEMPEFLSRLHAVYDFSVIEWRITLLVKLGIAPATISTLVNRSISSVTLSRRRLYKKVIRKEGTAKDWDEFIRSL